MENDLSDSIVNVRKAVIDLFEEETTWTEGRVFEIKIYIPPHSGRSGGLGIDTTRIYKELPPAKQYGHSVKMIPMKPNRNSRYYSDAGRACRQQDVIVTGISEITEKRWRADIDKDGIIALSINNGPIKVRRKQKDDLINDLNILLKMVSSPPSIVAN